MARSALSGIMQIFTLDTNDYDSLDEQWAKEIPPYHLDEENVYLSFRIEDMERYINPNYLLADSGEPEEKHVKQFRRLLKKLLLDPDLTNAVLDWLDEDEERRMPLGAEGMDYDKSGFLAKGGKLDSIDELKLVKGFKNEMFSKRVVDYKVIPGLLDVLALPSNGKINVNTAGRDVLLSLDDDMDEDVVAEIIRRRQDKPFEKMDDLLELPGMNHDLLFRIKQLADVKSEYFKITVSVENYSGDKADLVVITKRSGSSSSIVYWKVE